MSTTSAVWSPPQRFDEYELMSLIGRGGMGEVYLGHDTLLDRPVAIKFIRALDPDSERRDQLLNEARAAARIQHPNVSTIHRVGEIGGRPYIISEYISGRSLDLFPKPMPWQQALRISVGLSRALAAAHRRGVLHRDIKPGNAIISDNEEIKLLDFGLAKFVDVAVRPPELPPWPAQITVGGVALGQKLDGSAVLAPTETAIHSGPHIFAPQPHLPSHPDAEPVTAQNTPPLADAMMNASTMALNLQDSSGKFSPVAPVNQQTVAGLLKGTPVYMAPELWRGEPASRRSDVYSMGALMYELCSGDPPHATLSIEELSRVINKEDAPLSRELPDIHPGFAAIIDRCMRRDPSERYSSGEELREALEALQLGQHLATPPDGNPYRGLLAFEAEHRTLFFGRNNEIGTVLEHLRSESFVVVAADSGLGKSSLCRAGVLPCVEEGALGDGRRWETVTLLPGRHPVRALAAALSPILAESAATICDWLERAPATLAALIDGCLGRGRGLVLFIDQMEELISLSTEAEAAIVATALGGLTDRLRSVRLLATARSDFLARLATLPALGDELSRALYLLRPLSRDKLRDVIIGPAKAKGVRFESDGLVETLIDSTVNTEGGLPLLQFALAELWDAHKDSSITAMALADIGGVTGALARHADHVLQSLPEDQKAAARRILMQLVTLEGTRARRRESELLRDPASRAAVNALVHGRLIIVRNADGGAIYEVAHEALLKGWITLRRWLDDQAGSRETKQSLEHATANWMRLGQAPEALWGQRQLAEATNLPAEQINLRELEFIAASKRELRRRRLLRGALIGLLPLTLLFLYVGVQIKLRHDLNLRVMRLAKEGRELLQKARQRNNAALLGQQRAFLAFDIGHVDAGETEWSATRLNEAEANRHYSRASQVLESALALDPGRAELRDLIAEVLYERALEVERDRATLRRDDLVQRMALYDSNGQLLQKLEAPGRLKLRSDPAGASLTIAQYLDVNGRQKLSAERALGTTPIADLALAQGSYLLTLRAPGRREVRYPVLIGRDERLDVTVPLPFEEAVPAEFVYIPAGRFLFGTSADDTSRQSFLNTVPIHTATTEAYLIARHETTYAEWITYVKALRAAKNTAHGLRVGQTSMVGALSLTTRHGTFTLTLQLGNHVYQVREGEMLIYEGRKAYAAQDWLRMPVSGVTRDEAAAYAAWLDESGRLPGARLCSEREWERAARGADEREFPNGDQLQPTDANFDLTYGRDLSLMGPDQIGVHPGSRSPFGVEDLAGNVFEWTLPALDVKQAVARGGGYSYGSFTCRSTNRTMLDPGYRDPGLGVRICASWPLRK